MSGILTAFTKTAQTLRAQLREAIVDHEAFAIPLHRCELSRCRATCCHDGAVLSPEEADRVRVLLEKHPTAFPDSARDQPVVERDNVLKTATRPALDHECADDFPSPFTRTSCVFLDHEHKCTLQLLSSSQGKHPWHYKPISCWMHPILLRPASSARDRPVLTLRRPDQDQARFASCTHCGRPDPDGQPARDVLASELAALSKLAEREFTAELHAPSVEPGTP